VLALKDELGFELEEIAIDGHPELERRYRELIPVVEIDGKQAFVYFVQPDALRRKLAQAAP
jgi:glutaredoxin